jgi:DNA-binding SARP family transcriptional activator
MDVSGADGPISLTRAQTRTVLGLLLLTPGQVVAMHTIIDALWPDDGPEPPKNADNAVQQVVMNIRKALGDPALVERIPPGYLIRADPAEVDACRFRDAVVRARAETDIQRRVTLLRDALALWRGAPLSDVPTSALDVERQRLIDLRIEALDLCAVAELELGRHTEIIAELRGWVAEYSVSERLHHHLLVATFRSDGQGEALRAYDSCRRQLAEAAGADPGADLRELHTKILRNDPGLLEAGTATVPARREQLPFAPRGFTGRKAELRTLSAVSGGEGGLWVITGAGGIGKTTLVTHWAHENRNHFPDGNIFVDLQGHTPGGRPLPTGAALRGFLDAMGVDPRGIPPEHHAQVALWRSLSYGKRMLVVLDNAVNAEQITDLLPASRTCTVLITSRDQLTPLITSLGAEHLRLEVLDDHDARAMLSARSGEARLASDPAAVRGLLDLCAGLPLALSIAAGRRAGRRTARRVAHGGGHRGRAGERPVGAVVVVPRPARATGLGVLPAGNRPRPGREPHGRREPARAADRADPAGATAPDRTVAA